MVDLIKDALSAPVGSHGRAYEDVLSRSEVVTAFFQHLLDHGPDERMNGNPGFNVKATMPVGSLYWFESQRALLTHIKDRLQEISE